jgi:glycerophosphoryl diester phosphodiesterase
MSREIAYLAGPLPRIFAHRGFHERYPENSLSAFREAVKLGATHLETDVRVTRDGVAVLFHDASATVAGRKIPLSAMTYDELVSCFADREIPTLDSALEAFPAARFNIDIKDARAIAPVIAVLDARAAWRRVLLASFSETTRRKVLAAHSNALTSASRRLVILSSLFSVLRLQGLFQRVLRDIVALQIPERIGFVPLVTARLIANCHGSGVEVHVWTVNDTDDIHRLLSLGVDGIISDRCDRVVAVACTLPE